MHYFPLALPFLLVLAVILLLIVALAELRVLEYAYEKIGIHPRLVFGLLLLSLAGSYINIPVARLAPEEMVTDAIVTYWGVQYVVPTVHDWPATVIAVNVGGALIPTALSVFLMIRNRIWIRGLIGIAIVGVVVHMIAQPVRGVGIVTPIWSPPLLAAGAAFVLARGVAAPPLAFVSGTLGTLIGADIANLGHIQGLGAPVASIGGAGTFDGVFLAGIIAVLLVPVRFGRRRPPIEG